MGQFKEEGNAALALAEECAEVIQVITKAMRFGGDLNTIRPNMTMTRFEELEMEMMDVVYQWERLKAHYHGRPRPIDWDNGKFTRDATSVVSVEPTSRPTLQK